MPAELDALDDSAILKKAGLGNEAAFEQLVARHAGAVHRFIRTLTPDPAAGEDALQETFLAAWRSAATFRGEASVRSWLFTIARHAVFRQARRHAGEPAAVDRVPLDALGLAAGWGGDDPEQAAMRRERHAAVARALDALPPDDRQVLVLRDLEQLSGDEAAAILGVGLAALKSRLHRARLRFAAALRGEACDGHA